MSFANALDELQDPLNLEGLLTEEEVAIRSVLQVSIVQTLRTHYIL